MFNKDSRNDQNCEENFTEDQNLNFDTYQRYDKSKIWQVHNDYFLNIGLKAWTSGDIPYTGVSNYTEALKKASVFIENLKLHKLSYKTSVIRILEVGAGYGEFAINFLQALKQICEKEKLSFYQRCEYYISDYADTTLNELRNNPRLSKFINKIKFIKLDVLEKPDLEYKFHLILSTYLLDQFPARVIVKNNTKFYEKYLAISENEIISLKESASSKQRIKLPFSKPKNYIKKLKKEVTFREFDFDTIPRYDQLNLLPCFRKNSASSTIVYSYHSLQALNNLLSILAVEGLMIHSDFNAKSRPGFDNYEPCYYGNSIAQPVNFEYLYLSFKATKKVILFEDPIKPLHTFIMSHPDSDKSIKLGEAYNRIYKQNIFLRLMTKFLVEIQLGFYVLLIIMILYIVYYYLFSFNYIG